MAKVPRFYAELLENIKSIAISIDLPSPSDPTTRLDLTSSALLTVHHKGQSTPIILPGNVAPFAAHALQRPSPGQEKLSYRLPVAPSPPPHLPAEGYAPWTAMELNRGLNVAFTCRACSAEVIPKDKIKTWKDLPSSNWADMMDFWHCHKPNPPDSRQDGGGTSKYSAWQRGYMIEAGTALVDLTRFVLDEGDCVEAVEALEATEQGSRFLCCKACKKNLGVVDTTSPQDSNPATTGWTLYKWALADAQSRAPSFECFLSAQLLALAEVEGIRRIIFSSGDMSLRVWVFNTDIRYISSETRRVVRAVKVFWKPGAGDKGGMLSAGGFEETRVDEMLFRGLKEVLERSAQTFGEWRVGMVERFGGGR